MKYLIDGFYQAITLIFTLDKEIYFIVWVSLYCSLSATIISSVFALPAGFLIGGFEFRGKRPTVTIFNTLMALPTVVVGLFGYALLSRKGPLGFMELLFTPWAVIFGEVVLSFPIITALSISTTQGINPKIRETALTLGASPFQSSFAVFYEGRVGFLSAVIAGFGRVVAEVGSAMMLGGNIKGFTRTIPTAIALETSKGEFAFGLSLGIILLTLSLSINIFLHRLQGKVEG
jgi:tungstate transport system permease protein